MTTFAVGDKVRVAFGANAGAVDTVEAIGASGATAWLPSIYCHVHFNRLQPISPFNTGDKVVAVETNHGLGIRAGVVYTVVGSTWDEWDQTTILNVETSSGRRAWADVKRFKQYVPKPQVFELRYGDKVKNLHTGRVGQVFRNSRGELYVYDTVRPIRDGVPAAALEGYEDEYPGTYDIVFRRDSREPY